MSPLRRTLDVLLVEDERLLAQAEAACLRQRGHRVAVAGSALEALQLPAPDVVVSDVRLPLVSGLELIDLLHARCPELPVVLTSGSVAELDPTALAARGVVRILAKPFPLSELVEVVESAGARALARSAHPHPRSA